MNFNKHYELRGLHAYLGASKYHWLNYDEDKLKNSYMNFLATQKGTELHDFAAQAIKLGVKLQKTKATLNMYVNDAIGFKMTPEQPLYYSENCFGTADAISFRKNGRSGRYILRIHDLKTGVTPAKMEQLYIYAALFCLEYGVKPHDIDIELRIYQNDEVIIETPLPEDICMVMDKIVFSDKIIARVKLEEE